jgi:anti-sigma factor RsiW
MSAQHLSDEAVAAYADGVLRGHARERAAKHINACAECRTAVRVQREAALALRAACLPPAPSALVEKLRTVPMTTPMPAPLPTALAPDGTTMLSTFAPVAAFVPAPAKRGARVPSVFAAAARLFRTHP